MWCDEGTVKAVCDGRKITGSWDVVYNSVE